MVGITSPAGKGASSDHCRRGGGGETETVCVSYGLCMALTAFSLFPNFVRPVNTKQQLVPILLRCVSWPELRIASQKPLLHVSVRKHRDSNYLFDHICNDFEVLIL